ncbi:PREDICTED: uncharacterized protein LOC105458100, partial [Wasmannia auropunctata]|uniref:uncharacterized protein LOC105458100 n=1 Tax=Wasmannia auropunctata TaxID=64793 RepID=UPI0005EF5CAE
MQEAKKGKVSLLFDTGATLTLMKLKYVKDDTPLREDRMTLTGVTGHKIQTIGKIRATIPIGDRKVRHTVFIVRDDFPIEYEGILGIDFLQKQNAKCDLGKKQLDIGDTTLQMRPFIKKLKPRSETIAQAYTE